MKNLYTTLLFLCSFFASAQQCELCTPEQVLQMRPNELVSKEYADEFFFYVFENTDTYRTVDSYFFTKIGDEYRCFMKIHVMPLKHINLMIEELNSRFVIVQQGKKWKDYENDWVFEIDFPENNQTVHMTTVYYGAR